MGKGRGKCFCIETGLLSAESKWNGEKGQNNLLGHLDNFTRWISRIAEKSGTETLSVFSTATLIRTRGLYKDRASFLGSPELAVTSQNQPIRIQLVGN